jgi:hypothetical protein
MDHEPDGSMAHEEMYSISFPFLSHGGERSGGWCGLSRPPRRGGHGGDFVGGRSVTSGQRAGSMVVV